jgi:hypothetical protein
LKLNSGNYFSGVFTVALAFNGTKIASIRPIVMKNDK